MIYTEAAPNKKISEAVSFGLFNASSPALTFAYALFAPKMTFLRQNKF